MPKVVWLDRVHGPNGITVQRVEATLIGIEETWCTIEFASGERWSVLTEQIEFVDAARAS